MSHFVELAPLSDPTSIISAIAEATSYQFQPDGREPKQQILDFLSNKKMLLIMDNYEHLLESALLTTYILKAAPGVKILVTSRQRLNQSAEMVFNLQGMDFPTWQTTDDALEYAAVKLFLQGAKRSKADFEVTTDNMDAIARICKLVDGLPLGILLAASWLALLSPEEIASEIDKSIDFLASDLSDVPERQRSVRAVFDYSWDLMNEDEQSAFMKLSVFGGGFTRAAAEAIAGANLRILMSLLNKSVIRRDVSTGRFEIHELLRQYAAEHLSNASLVITVRDAHANYYADFMVERELDIKGRNQIQGLQAVDIDFANIQLAWRWAAEQHNYELLNRMLEGVKLFCEMQNRYAERFMFFVETRQQLFPSPDNTPHFLWCRMMVRHAGFQQHQGDVRGDFQKCLDFAKQQNDTHEIAYCLYALADANATLREIAAAIALYQESLKLYKELDDKFYVTKLLNLLGAIHIFTGQLEIGAEFGRQSILFGRQCGNYIDTGWALHTVAMYHYFIGDMSKVAEHNEEARRIWLEVGNQDGLSAALAVISGEFIRRNNIEKAREYADAALTIASNINNKMRISAAIGTLGLIATWEGNYEKGLAVALEVLSQSDRMPNIKMVTYEGLILATLGLQEYKRAKEYVQEYILYVTRVNPRRYSVAIAMSAMVFAHEEHYEYAAELLGLCYDIGGLVNIASWLPFVQLPEKLKAELGQEAYNTAHERGKSLDVDTVVRELLDKFAQENQ